MTTDSEVNEDADNTTSFPEPVGGSAVGAAPRTGYGGDAAQGSDDGNSFGQQTSSHAERLRTMDLPASAGPAADTGDITSLLRA